MNQISVDQDELLHRGLAHPVAGPHLQVIMRDLALEQAHARIKELEGGEVKEQPTP